MKSILYLAGLIASFVLGVWLSSRLSTALSTQLGVSKTRPVYLVASWDVVHPDQLKPFVDAALPLAQKIGFEPLADAEPQVLEGSWPYRGIVIVQKYPSMRALLKFWQSPENEAAQKLREAHVDSHFIIAVETQEQPSSK